MANKILIVGPAWVGDMVIAQSLFLTLQQASPESVIDVLAPPWTLPLLAKMPQVRNALALPLTHGQFGLATRFKLGKQLRANRYEQAIVLPNAWKAALIPWFAAIPIRTGYLGECRYGLLNDIRMLNKTVLPMTVQRFAALGLAGSAPLPPDYPLPTLAVSADEQLAVCEKFNVKPTGKILALCPGAEYGPAKQWPSRYFAELAKVKHEQGWQVWLFGSGKDSLIAAAINQASGNICRDFTGRTELSDAVDLMSLANSVVSNDSGLMHIAAALAKPLIAIYGSSSPDFTPPLSGQARIVALNPACSPCFKRVCPLYPPEHERHLECLTGITPEQILALLP